MLQLLRSPGGARCWDACCIRTVGRNLLAKSSSRHCCGQGALGGATCRTSTTLPSSEASCLASTRPPNASRFWFVSPAAFASVFCRLLILCAPCRGVAAPSCGGLHGCELGRRHCCRGDGGRRRAHGTHHPSPASLFAVLDYSTHQVLLARLWTRPRRSKATTTAASLPPCCISWVELGPSVRRNAVTHLRSSRRLHASDRRGDQARRPQMVKTEAATCHALTDSTC